MAINIIEGTITRDDGKKISFCITSEGYHQWGETVEVLGDTVAVVQDLTNAARDHLFVTQ